MNISETTLLILCSYLMRGYMCWEEVFDTIDKRVPQFDTYLIDKYRKECVEQTIGQMEYLFNECLRISGGVEYLGHYILSPEEQVHRDSTARTKWKFEISETEWRTVRFDFRYKQQVVPVFLNTPHLRKGLCFVFDGQSYYITFALVEKGINIIPNGAVIKVLSSLITINRTRTTLLRDEHKKYTGVVNLVKGKIHHKTSEKPDKQPPLFLYHLIDQGFYGAFKKFGFKQDQFGLVSDAPADDNEFLYFRLKKDIFLKVHNDFKYDTMQKRAVASYLEIINRGKKRFTISHLLHPEPTFYMTNLGRYIFNQGNDALLCSNIADHTKSLKNYIDPKAKQQLSKTDINVENIYELLYVVEENLAKWLVEYKPTNMYNKRLGAIDEMMSAFIQELFTYIYKIGNKKSNDIGGEVIRQLSRTPASSMKFHIRSNKIPEMAQCFNNNYLFTIGARCFRSHDNIENRKSSNRKAAAKIPEHLVVHDPSIPVVETLCVMPTSQPATTGNINVFLPMDSGDIKEPYYAEINKRK
ncbi:MAG: hypothetical protein GY804_09495 [Alphaproteobacteria bacterium]|nr:hypothetical protein [Alphaproteobacteria bacterium]